MDNLSFDSREGYIWYNGDILEWKNANVHVLNHGLHYASCVFEVKEPKLKFLKLLNIQKGFSIQPNLLI